MTYNKFQLYGILKDYHWMIKEIKQIDYELSKTEFQGVAQYGIEATLPHAVGIVGRAIENEVIRRSKKSERMIDYAKKVNFIHERIHKITDEKEKVVLDSLLDGYSLTAISKHLRMSRQNVTDIRDKIVENLAK
jgi:DNA-binding NarL/FixJ family response regulator